MQAKLNPAFAAALKRARIVPVLTVDTPAQAVPLARALAAGGLATLEVTLRTPAALEALAAMAREVTGVTLGAGTVRDPGQGDAAIAAGAKFLVSPGMTPRLLEAAQGWRVPFLPGVATASEAMALADLGYRVLKFFPAEPSGGLAKLKALAQPLADIRFCPTGGISAGNVAAYLAAPNVVAVGGSWMAPANLVAAGDWAGITKLAQDAMAAAG
ncbi:MAG: bifunctional 4-hydroxy-2-oxoglutarate aldolase/2-dehydro-3-deoxy-phosphogluconate aldolase [Hyphomicrobiaceae bacterium]